MLSESTWLLRWRYCILVFLTKTRMVVGLGQEGGLFHQEVSYEDFLCHQASYLWKDFVLGIVWSGCYFSTLLSVPLLLFGEGLLFAAGTVEAISKGVDQLGWPFGADIRARMQESLAWFCSRKIYTWKHIKAETESHWIQLCFWNANIFKQFFCIMYTSVTQIWICIPFVYIVWNGDGMVQ